MKSKLLYEFKQNLDEKIFELKKKLNMTNLNTETDNNIMDENKYNKFLKGKNITVINVPYVDKIHYGMGKN